MWIEHLRIDLDSRHDDAGARSRQVRHLGADLDGFTLIEVLIVLVILAILAAIALPSYAEHLRKSARAEAQSFLTDVAARQHQFMVDRRRYATSLTALGMAPPDNVKKKFVDPVAITAPDVVPPVFTLTAQATGDQVKDKCPTLTLDSAGNRTPADCW